MEIGVEVRMTHNDWSIISWIILLVIYVLFILFTLFSADQFLQMHVAPNWFKVPESCSTLRQNDEQKVKYLRAKWIIELFKETGDLQNEN